MFLLRQWTMDGNFQNVWDVIVFNVMLLVKVLILVQQKLEKTPLKTGSILLKVQEAIS